MVAPAAVIVIKIGTNVLTLCCATLRYVILRKRNKHPSTLSTLCHVLLFLACISDFTASGAATWILGKEIGLQRRYDGRTADSMLAVTVEDKLFWSHMMYYLSLAILKAAYLCYYATLYDRVKTKRRIALYGATAVWAACYITGILLLFLWCPKFSDNWNPNATNPRCPVLFSLEIFVVLSCMNIASDLAILVVPLLLLSAFKFTRRDRLSVVFVFLVGSTSIVSSIVRLGVVAERFLGPDKFTWETVHRFWLISHFEVLFGLLAFCLPSFRYLILSWLQHGSGASRAETSVLRTDTEKKLIIRMETSYGFDRKSADTGDAKVMSPTSIVSTV